MTVLDHDPVLALVSGLDLGDGEHDHVVVVAVTDELVPPSLLADGGALQCDDGNKCWSTGCQLSDSEDL